MQLRRILRATSALPIGQALGLLAGTFVKQDLPRIFEKKDYDTSHKRSLVKDLKLELPKLHGAPDFKLSTNINKKVNELEEQTGIGDKQLFFNPNRYVLLEFPEYFIYYDKLRHNPGVAYEYLTVTACPEEVTRTPYFWHRDARLIDGEKIYLSNPPYVKGRMACVENHRKSDVDQNSTYFITNSSPQHIEHSHGIWSSLEQYAKGKLLLDTTKGVHVFTGPVWKNMDKGKVKNTEIDIPTHFFKVIITEKKDGTYHMESFMIPNESDENTRVEGATYPENLLYYLTSLQEIDAYTGLNLGKRRKCLSPLIEKTKTIWDN